MNKGKITAESDTLQQSYAFLARFFVEPKTVIQRDILKLTIKQAYAKI